MFRQASENDAFDIKNLFNENNIQDDLKSLSEGRTFILLCGKTMVGSITAIEKNYFTNKKSLFLNQFLITSSLQKQGLGSIVLDFCEQLANDEKYESIQIASIHTIKYLADWFLSRGYKSISQKAQDASIPDFSVFEKTLKASFIKKV